MAALPPNSWESDAGRNSLEAVWSGLPVGLIAVDRQGTIELYNPAVEKLFGYRRDELLGSNIDVLVPAFAGAARRHDGLIAEFLKADAAAPAGSVLREAVGQHKNGDAIPLEFSVAKARHGENEQFVAIVKDLTSWRTIESDIEERDRRLAKNELEFQAVEAAIAASTRHMAEAEFQLQAIVNNVPGAIYRCLPDDGWPVTFVSDAIEAITGRPAGDYVKRGKRSLDDIVHPDDREEAKAIVRNSIERRQAFELDYRVSRQDGQVRYVRERGQPVCDDAGELLCVTGVIVDVTERRMAESSLRASERRYREIFDESPAPIWEDDWSGVKQWLEQKSLGAPEDWRRYFEQNPRVVCDLYDRAEIREISRGALDMFGAANREQLLASAQSARLSQDELSAFRNTLLSFLDNRFLFEFELDDYCMDGTEAPRTFRYRASIPESHRKDWGRVIYVIEDVTENRRARNELTKLFWALEQSPNAMSIMGIDGTIEYVNQRFQSMTGFDADQAIGRPACFWKNTVLSESEGARLWRQVVRFGRWESEFVNQTAWETLIGAANELRRSPMHRAIAQISFRSRKTSASRRRLKPN